MDCRHFYSLFFYFLFQQLSPAYSTNPIQPGFIENRGQIYNQEFQKSDTSYRFLLPLNNMNVALKSTGFSYNTYQYSLKDSAFNFHRVDIEFLNCNVNVDIESYQPYPWYLNYYNSVTPEQGVNFVKHYKKIVYKNLYPSIDLEFVTDPENSKPIEYNFVLHQGANINDIKLHYSGMNRAELFGDTLKLNLVHGELKETIPLSYWLENKKKETVCYNIIEETVDGITIGFLLKKNQIIHNTLIIDPAPNLGWSTYYGGTGNDDGNNPQSGDVCNDKNGNAILLSNLKAAAASLVTTGAHQVTFGGGMQDAVISKFDAAGSLQWATYYGGSGLDVGYSVEADTNNNIFVAGLTLSTNAIASTGTHQSTFSCSGACNASFITKFDASGVRQWGTYFYDNLESLWLVDLAVDNNGDVLVCGTVQGSSGVATSGKYKSTYTWSAATVVGCFAKFNGSNGTRAWGSYLTKQSYPKGIDTDPSGNIFITGYGTTYFTFPGPVINILSDQSIVTAGAHQTIHGGGVDAFITKFDVTGTTLLWGTLYGGGGGPGTVNNPAGDDDMGNDLVCDNSGNVYVCGLAYSKNNIATAGSHQPAHSITGVGVNGFLVKFNASGVRQWATYYPGAINEIAADNCGNIFIAGACGTAANIASPGAYQLNHSGAGDSFLGKFNSSGNRYWGTYLGGTGSEDARGIAISSTGSIYFTGTTYSSNFPVTPGAFQTLYGGGGFGNKDAFLSCFQDTAGKPTLQANPGTICPNGTATISIASGNLNGANKWYWYEGGCGGNRIDSISSLSVSPSITTTYYARGEGDCLMPGECDSIIISVISASPAGSNTVSICQGDSILIGNQYQSIPGNYADTIVAGSVTGCDSIINITLAVTTSLNTSGTAFICDGDSINVHGFFQTTAGIYTQTFIGANGCDSVSAITINLIPSSAPTNISTSLCPGDSILINGTYRKTAGIYSDTLNNAGSNGCDSIVNITINMYPSASATITATSCSSYLSPGGKTHNSSGTYTDSLVTLNGCDSMLTINLTIYGNVINTINVPNACDSVYINGVWHFNSKTIRDTIQGGSSAGCDSIINTVIIINNSKIFYDSINICPGNSILINGIFRNTPGVYTSTFTSITGCDSISAIILSIDTLPEVSISVSSATISPGEPTTLTATGAIIYEWSTNSSASTIMVTPGSQTQYCVRGINNSGCEDTACVNIFVNSIECDPHKIKIPNAFSPNSDGQNDFLCVYGETGCFEAFHIKIFNRWGEKVYESGNRNACWDGTDNGKKLNSGIYIYYLLNNTNDAEEILKSGNITLIK